MIRRSDPERRRKEHGLVPLNRFLLRHQQPYDRWLARTEEITGAQWQFGRASSGITPEFVR